MHGNDQNANSGEVLQWRRRGGLFRPAAAAGAPPSLPRYDLHRSIAILRPKKKDTPSPDRFLKETLEFLIIEPAVLGARKQIRFLSLKTYSWLVEGKYVFCYLQFCH